MPQLGHLWLGTVTAGFRGSGTNSRVVLIVNVDGNKTDNVHHTFSDTSQDDLERNQANIYEVTQEHINTVTSFLPGTVDTDTLNTSSIRIATTGSDAWIPRSVLVWGREQRDAGEVVPLGLVIDLQPSLAFVGTLAGVTLSTDSDEGQSSFGVPRVTPGGAAMLIRSLIVALVTANEDDAGTDDLIHIRITTADGRVVVDRSITDTAQKDQEEGQANLYFVPVATPFSRAELSDRSIELSIRGDDAWLPGSFFLFGLGEELPAAFSPLVEPLVHLAKWSLGWLSTDSDEGREAVALPLLPSSSVIP